MDKILLIDGQNAIFRASVIFGSPKEVDDSYIIIFNFFRNLRVIIEKFSPDKCFFALEGHPKFRYDLYSDYKANRIIKEASKQAARDKVLKCSEDIVRLLNHIPITICRAANFEADDLIGTLCENLKDEDLTVLTNDSDYIQLLQRNYSNIKIYNPIKKEFMAAPAYSQIVFKCIAGDKSDNIPALLKPKQVTKHLEDPELFAKFLQIEENRANFNINRQLVEFRMIHEEEISLVEGVRNFDLLKQEFSKMKFESIINENSWNKFVHTFDCLKY